MVWKPNTTVATVVKHANKFLIVEEKIQDKIEYNQPAGHLDEGESLLDAAVRETYEETGYRVKLTAFIGVYRWIHPENKKTMMRFAFHADVIDHDTKAKLDTGIIAAHWKSFDEINELKNKLRSPLVLKTFLDSITSHYPLALIEDI